MEIWSQKRRAVVPQKVAYARAWRFFQVSACGPWGSKACGMLHTIVGAFTCCLTLVVSLEEAEEVGRGEKDATDGEGHNSGSSLGIEHDIGRARDEQ